MKVDGGGFNYFYITVYSIHIKKYSDFHFTYFINKLQFSYVFLSKV